MFIETFDSIQLRAKYIWEASRTEGIAISVMRLKVWEGYRWRYCTKVMHGCSLVMKILKQLCTYSLNDGSIGVSA